MIPTNVWVWTSHFNAAFDWRKDGLVCEITGSHVGAPTSDNGIEPGLKESRRYHALVTGAGSGVNGFGSLPGHSELYRIGVALRPRLGLEGQSRK